MVGSPLLWPDPPDRRQDMKKIRCAIYTRKSTEEGLEQEFNSLDAQRDVCAAYVARSTRGGCCCRHNTTTGHLRRHHGEAWIEGVTPAR